MITPAKQLPSQLASTISPIQPVYQAGLKILVNTSPMQT